MRIHKKWWFLVIIIFVIIVTGFLINKFSPVGCSYQYNKIESELDSLNYCTVDSDCKVLPLGSTYIEFGCYHFINKDVDGEQIYRKMSDYWDRCSEIIDRCASAPEARCINNICIEK